MSCILSDNDLMELKDIISKNLKALRESYDMKQSEFARRCNMHQRTYGRMENGEGWQHLESISQIAKECDLQAWQLLTPGFNPKNPPVLKEASEKERLFYENIKKAAKELSKYESQ